MKNIVVNYKVFSEKLEGKRIILLTDLHNYPGGRETTIVEDIKKENPDLIVVSGDILKADRYEIGSKSQENLKQFLSDVSEESPVFLGLGNHDLYGADSKMEEGYKDLETAKSGNVHPLSNESVELGNVRLTEFHPTHDVFSPAVQDSGKALLDFEEEFRESGLEVPENDPLYNVLILHNPVQFVQGRMISESLKLDISPEQFDRLTSLSEKLSKFDLVLSGHKHGGYIPLSMVMKNPEKYLDEGYWEMPMEKNIRGKVTMIRPWVYKKTNLCRGAQFVGNSKSRIIELANGSYYLVDSSGTKEPVELTEEKAKELIDKYNMTVDVISGGVNPFFNLPIGGSEITEIDVLKK